jgi:hypothetical protein
MHPKVDMHGTKDVDRVLAPRPAFLQQLPVVLDSDDSMGPVTYLKKEN